jgi:hypothetical protein
MQQFNRRRTPGRPTGVPPWESAGASRVLALIRLAAETLGGPLPFALALSATEQNQNRLKKQLGR